MFFKKEPCEKVDWLLWCKTSEIAFNHCRFLENILRKCNTFEEAKRVTRNLDHAHRSLSLHHTNGYYHFDKNKINEFISSIVEDYHEKG